MTRQPVGRRRGWAWLGLVVGLLGLGLLITATALAVHAAEAPRFEAGERIETAPAGSIHLVGAGEGDTRCTVTSAGRTETIEVASRAHRLDSIAAGRRLPAGAGPGVGITCDRAVAVATGPVVVAYPLAGFRFWYATYPGLTVLGLTWFAVRRRLARPRTPEPVTPSPERPVSTPPAAPEQRLSADAEVPALPSGPPPPPPAQGDILKELAYGDPHAALARMRSQAGHGLRAYLVFAVVFAGSTFGLALAVTFLVVWPLSLLTGRWEPAPILLVIPGAVALTYLAMRRWAGPR